MGYFRKQKSLAKKILLVLIPLTIIPLLILAGSVLSLSGRSLKEQVEQANEDLAREAAREISAYVESCSDILLTLSEILGKARLNPIQQRYAIGKIAQNTDRFNQISLTDSQGREILSSDPEAPLRDLSESPLFLQGQKALFISREISRNTYTGIPQLQISVPLRRLNQVEGILRASVNLRRMGEAVQEIRFGKTGIAYILRQDGRYLIYPDPGYVLKDYHFPDPGLLRKTPSDQVYNSRTRNFTGQDVFCSCAALEELGLYVVVEKTASEALRSNSQILLVSLGLMLLLVLAGILVSVRSTRSLLRPINALVRGFEKVSQGDLEEQIPVESADEVAIMTRGFNSMTRELKSKRSHLLELQERLKHSERLSAIGAVVSRVSHEIRKPLSSLKILSSSLTGNKVDQEKQKRIVEFIPQEIDRLSRIVDDTLSTVRRIPRKKEACPLADLINDLHLMIHDQAMNRGVHLMAKIPEPSPVILGSRDHLFQILLNLVQNALEVLEQDGLITISASSHSDKKQIRILVEDNGPGIPEEQIKSIFKPFVSFKEGGTGIGLAVVSQIVKEHMGKIEVSSTPGKGTIFTILLPEYKEEISHENRSDHKPGSPYPAKPPEGP